jgi:Putative MetA-pathway of phenol degradation
MKTKHTTGLTVVVLSFIVGAIPGFGQEGVSSPASEPVTLSATNQTPSVEELVKLKQNPVSGLRQVVLQGVIGPDVPDSGKTAGDYSLQVVWPFSLNEDWKLISYTILPVLQVPVPSENTKLGLGDTLINLFVSPKKPGKLIWGGGPAILLPTRTDPDLDSDRLGLGPALVLYYEQKSWNAGVVLQNGWSLGGEGINEVNTFGAQYTVTYNLPNGWFLYSNATITADWTKDDSDRWTVPVGGGFGKVFTLGKQAMSLSLQGLANVIKPRTNPLTIVNVQFSLLFP